MASTRELFLRHQAQTTAFPMGIEVERGEGIYLYSPDGKQYTDLISGIAVSNLGHGHPKIVQAVQQQAASYMHTMVYGEYIQSPQAKLAQKLSSLLPDSLDNVYFVNSGSEAIEGALKLAKRHTGRTELISFQNAYHGSTHGALSIQGSEEFKNAFRPLLPDTRLLDFNDFDQLQQITERTAAVIAEPIGAEAGIRLPKNDFLKALRNRCTETGTLLILDEIQTGYGRTGKLFALEHYGIVPDILCLAKSMGGGMPLGAFIASQALMSNLSESPILGHITTFGGHPVCCAAGLAALEILTTEPHIAEIEAKEQLLRQNLTHPAIQEIRSKGLLMAVQFESFELLQAIINRCIANGVLVDWFLFCNNSMRIAPPLIITDKQLLAACDAINKSVAEAVGS